MINTLTHGSTDGPKQDTNSPAKQMAKQWRNSRVDPQVKELLQIVKELLAMEELDIGDRSLLPEDHPIARAEHLLEDVYKF